MYDKYFSGNTFTVNGSKLPKHKGILISGGTATTPTSSFYLLNSGGNTISVPIAINQSPYILPIQVYGVNTLAAGLTAYYLN